MVYYSAPRRISGAVNGPLALCRLQGKGKGGKGKGSKRENKEGGDEPPKKRTRSSAKEEA